MRFRRDRRGQIRIIEAFFASMLMLSMLAMIPALQTNTLPARGGLSTEPLKVLTSLDGNGHLTTLVDQHNWTALRDCFEAVISPVVWFNVTVFDHNMTPLNTAAISNGGPASERIESAEYICTSLSADFAVYIVRLQLAGVN
jgi:hypothetical protein